MKELRIFGICICVLLGTVMGNAASKLPSSVTMSKVQLENKIKGGWPARLSGLASVVIRNLGIKELLFRIIRRFLGGKVMCKD
mgnify:CR=1 FL=1